MISEKRWARVYRCRDASLHQVKSAGRGAGKAADQLSAQIRAGALAKMSEPRGKLLAEGIANGVTAVTGPKSGEPPASPGMVLTRSAGGAGETAAPMPGMPGAKLPTSVIASSNGSGQSGKDRMPISEPVDADNGLRIESNPKHTPGMQGNHSNAGTEPKDSLALFNTSVRGGEGVRYARDASGNINRFSSNGNGVYHWSGSTGDKNAPLNTPKIPIEIRRAFNFQGKK